MIDTPQMEPLKAKPVYSAPVGVKTVFSVKGRWLRAKKNEQKHKVISKRYGKFTCIVDRIHIFWFK
jgi:hypothetical protein